MEDETPNFSSTAKPFLPGDVVLTSYGVGVIASCPSTETHIDAEKPAVESISRSPSYNVLLWRSPGKSIASSSHAYLQADAVSPR